MIRIVKLIAILIVTILFIWLFGFTFGYLLKLVFIDPNVEIKYNSSLYSLSIPFPGYYLSGLLFSIPLFLLLYLVMNKFKSNVVFQNNIIILVFRGQFWHFIRLLKGDFQVWLGGEHSDRYFSISSCLAVLLFTFLIRRHFKQTLSKPKVIV